MPRTHKKWDHAWMLLNWEKHEDDELAVLTGHTEKAVVRYRQRKGWKRTGQRRNSPYKDIFKALENALSNGITVHISREKYGNVVRGSKMDIEGNKRVSPVLVTKFVEALPPKINELTEALK